MQSDTSPSDAVAPALLLWVPRFWPATGGTELHTHALATHMASRAPVEVVTHCDVTLTTHRNLPQEVCRTVDSSRRDGQVLIHRLGLAGAGSALPERLADRYDGSRLVRAAFSPLFAHHIGPAVEDIARRADLIHFVYNGLTDAAMLARRVAARRGVPFVFTPNAGDTDGKKTAWTSRRFRSLYRSATRLVALTEHEADWLAGQGADPASIRVVPYGPILEPDADARRAREALGVGDAPLVLFLGRVTELKGYDLLLAARERIHADFPDARIVFMGPATPASREAIRAVDDPRMTIVEDADQRLKSDALAACDLMCLPSRAESLGVVYVEAAFNARPVVCLDLPVLRDTVGHDVHGLRVAERGDALADAVCALLGDPERRRRLGERALRDAHARYSWEAVLAAMSTVYAEALEVTRS